MSAAKLPTRARTAKDRCRRVISLMPAGSPLREDLVARAITELVKATGELETELAAMKVKRAKTAKRRIPRGGLVDVRGRKRGGGSLPGFNTGIVPGNKGETYEKTPPTVHETLRMLDLAPSLYKVIFGKCGFCGAHGGPHDKTCMNPYGERMRAAILLMWRGGFRVGCELVRLREIDLYPVEGYVHIRLGKNSKPRDVAIDDWVWPKLEPWLRIRKTLPAGPLFCVIDGPTAGRQWDEGTLRRQLHNLAKLAGVRQRCAPHQLRHAMASQALVDNVNILYLQRQLGHANLAITTKYLESLPQSLVIEEFRKRPVPSISALDLWNAPGAGDGRRFEKPVGATSPDLMGVLAP